MRAEELRLSAGSETVMNLKEVRAHLAENLGSFLAVIEVEVDMRSATAGAYYMNRNR